MQSLTRNSRPVTDPSKRQPAAVISALLSVHFSWFFRICHDAPFVVGRIANPTYAVPSDMLIIIAIPKEPFCSTV
ncbi:MAG: hypothetical protein L0287_30760 [Anaerolineae bacterium]|nr:hypothetical protein [Anaerolineae bacterium]